MKSKMHKFMDVEVKAAEDGSGAYWFTASTPARDRQGDVIVQEGWKTQDFMKNPVILWGHNYYETPIGKALEIKLSPDSLAAKIQFVPGDIDPFAGKVEKLVANGYLKTVSVGFMVYKSEPLTTADLAQRPDMKYGSRLFGDLLEISVVPVPANPEALNQNSFTEVMARGYGLRVDEAKSKFLPFQDKAGEVNERLLRASLAAALGARGGIAINDADMKACINYLYRVAGEKGINVPHGTNIDLQKEFRDVWHDELLDVLNNAKVDDEDVQYKLVKGQKRSEILKARDALNSILILSEESEDADVKQETKAKSESETELLNQISEITKNLTAVNDRLH